MSARPLLSWQIVAVVVLIAGGLIDRLGLPEFAERVRFRSGPMRFMDSRLAEIRAAERAPDSLRVIALGDSLTRFSLGAGDDLNAALDSALPDDDIEAHILAFPAVSFLHFEPFLFDVLRAEPDLLLVQIDLFYPTGARDSMHPQDMWVPLGESFARRTDERTAADKNDIQRDWSDLVLTQTHSRTVGAHLLSVAADRGVPVVVLDVPVSQTLHEVVPEGYFDDRASRVTAFLHPGQEILRFEEGYADTLTSDYRHLNAEGQARFIAEMTPRIVEALGR